MKQRRRRQRNRIAAGRAVAPPPLGVEQEDGQLPNTSASASATSAAFATSTGTASAISIASSATVATLIGRPCPPTPARRQTCPTAQRGGGTVYLESKQLHICKAVLERILLERSRRTAHHRAQRRGAGKHHRPREVCSCVRWRLSSREKVDVRVSPTAVGREGCRSPSDPDGFSIRDGGHRGVKKPICQAADCVTALGGFSCRAKQGCPFSRHCAA